TQPAERARPGFPSLTISGFLSAALQKQSEILRFTQDDKFCRFMRWLVVQCINQSETNDQSRAPVVAGGGDPGYLRLAFPVRPRSTTQATTKPSCAGWADLNSSDTLHQLQPDRI